MKKISVVFAALMFAVSPLSAQTPGDVNQAVDFRINAATTALRAILEAEIAAITPGGTGIAAISAKDFGGRLTLQSGSPVITTDQVGAQKLYYAPDSGRYVPIKTAGSWMLRDFTASSSDQVGLTFDMQGSASFPADSLQDVFAIYDGGVVRLATRQWDSAMYDADVAIPAATTITTLTGSAAWVRAANAFDGNPSQPWASAARIYPSNSGLANCIGQSWGTPQTVSKFKLTAASDNNLQGGGSGALQLKAIASNDGLNWTALGFYYVDASVVGASYTIPINEGNQVPYLYHEVCVTGDPTYSVNVAELQFFTRVAGSRRLTRDSGILVNDAPITARIDPTTTASVAAGEASYLGTVHITPSAPGRMTAHVSYGPDRAYDIWNLYNQRTIKLSAGVISPGISAYTLSAQRWQLAQPGFSLQILQGIAGDFIPASLIRGFYINAAPGRKLYEAGIAVDNVMSFSGTQISAVTDNTGPQLGQFQTGYHDVRPFAGLKKLNAIERTDSGAGIVSPFVELRSTALSAWWRG